MGYYEFTITVSDRSKDALLNRMSEMGSLGVSERERKVIAYFKDTHDIIKLRDGLKAFKNVLKEAGLDHEFSFDYLYLGERDWNESWKKRFVPIDVGEELSILPPWQKSENGRIPLIIDPGMAFGTGHHETTRRCLTLIEKFSKEGNNEESSPSPNPSPQGRGSVARDSVGLMGMRKERFLDVGTGSGILGVAASKLGFKEVVGVDIDPLAVDAAKRNAELNGLANVTIKEGSISDVEGAFDMIAANLMSEVLIAIGPEIASRLGDEGITILSGMLSGQEDDVISAMKKVGLCLSEKIIDGRWVSLVLTSSARSVTPACSPRRVRPRLDRESL